MQLLKKKRYFTLLDNNLKSNCRSESGLTWMLLFLGNLIFQPSEDFSEVFLKPDNAQTKLHHLIIKKNSSPTMFSAKKKKKLEPAYIFYKELLFAWMYSKGNNVNINE